ncbi:MAG: P1 family peptidase [bacterium]|nr:P1 family peptidase [bacterium]
MQRTRTPLVAVALAAALATAAAGQGQHRPRIRDLGVRPGVLPTGELNAITDVAGVRVGHQTVRKGKSVRTGVTAIVPHGGDLFRYKTPAAVYVGNGFGKAAGFLQVAELGTLETPIVLTNTLSVGRAVEAVIDWTLAQPNNQDVRSVNAVVGETNDGYLNDITGMYVRKKHVIAAIESAQVGPVAEGSVGAGTGTSAFGWKGGIGTSSRKLPPSLGSYTVGVLVQTNFGGVLTVDGAPVGEELGQYSFREELEAMAAYAAEQVAAAAAKEAAAAAAKEADSAPEDSAPVDSTPAESGDGSCMIVVATDAPLSPRNLERVARRAVLGLARTGSFLSNGSGDFVIAFTTKNRTRADAAGVRRIEDLPNNRMSPIFLATVEAVEEAVYNSLTRATTVKGYKGHVREAIPIRDLRQALKRPRALTPARD